MYLLRLWVGCQIYEVYRIKAILANHSRVSCMGQAFDDDWLRSSCFKQSRSLLLMCTGCSRQRCAQAYGKTDNSHSPAYQLHRTPSLPTYWLLTGCCTTCITCFVPLVLYLFKCVQKHFCLCPLRLPPEMKVWVRKARLTGLLQLKQTKFGLWLCAGAQWQLWAF